MGDEVQPAQPATKEPNQFTAILDKLSKQFQRQDPKPPEVRVALVEFYAGQMMKFGYDFTPDSMSILADYLKGYNLWLCGNVGVGKTFFFECMSAVRRARGYDRIVKLSMIDTQGWDMEAARDWAEEYRDEDVLIDDVGTEPTMKSWGQEAELFPYLLEKRMQISGRRTHLTSNLGILDIKRRYGERVSDRFVEMFKMEMMKARKSRRRLSPWKTPRDGEVVL